MTGMPPRIPPATRPADALDREVALRAHIDQSGLTVGGKSRALAAIDRLIGGVFGWPAEFFEGKRAQAQARGEAREAMIRADAVAATRQLEGMSEVGQATLERFLRDEFRKQDNRAAVATHATEQLLALPHLAAEQSEAELSVPDADPPELDDDWINIFSGYVEHASSERLRDLWGRILAGEVRKPGSFAPTTLRVIAETDAEIAREFQEVYRLSVSGCSLRPEPFEGAVLEKFAFLEEVRLAQTDPNLSVNITAAGDGFGYFFGDQVMLRVAYMPGVTAVSFPAIRITRVGRQIGTILPRDETEALRQIGRKLTSAKKVELGVITGRRGTAATFKITEVLHESQ